MEEETVFSEAFLKYLVTILFPTKLLFSSLQLDLRNFFTLSLSFEKKEEEEERRRRKSKIKEEYMSERKEF